MSEHASNPRALLMQTLPPLLPVGHVVQSSLQIQVVPNERIALHMPGEAPTPGDGKRPHELGKPLSPDDCDVIVVVATSAQDGMSPAILGPGGRAAPNVSTLAHTVLARIPLVEWQAGHLGQLRGAQS